MVLTASRDEFTIPRKVEVDNSWIVPLAVVPEVRNHLRSSSLPTAQPEERWQSPTDEYRLRSSSGVKFLQGQARNDSSSRMCQQDALDGEEKKVKIPLGSCE